ncbi:hypothetical protein MED121_01860 [Marinomonas sp. MED121]|nr:hypothetical protein MED121_01860 [Marinomonas sp. MED121]
MTKMVVAWLFDRKKEQKSVRHNRIKLDIIFANF